MVSHCVVANKLVVSNDYKQNWVPESEEVDGSMYMRVCKWDRCFVKFCTGKALKFSGIKRQDVNVDFVDKLQRLRTAAVDAALAGLVDAEPDAIKKRRRMRKARLDDRDVLPPVVTMICPALYEDDRMIHDELSMRVRFGIKNHDLWMEATPENLEYVRLGVLSALQASQLGRKRHKRRNGDIEDGEDGADDFEDHEDSPQHEHTSDIQDDAAAK
jgi:hypothetical protein